MAQVRSQARALTRSWSARLTQTQPATLSQNLGQSFPYPQDLNDTLFGPGQTFDPSNPQNQTPSNYIFADQNVLKQPDYATPGGSALNAQQVDAEKKLLAQQNARFEQLISQGQKQAAGFQFFSTLLTSAVILSVVEQQSTSSGSSTSSSSPSSSSSSTGSAPQTTAGQVAAAKNKASNSDLIDDLLIIGIAALASSYGKGGYAPPPVLLSNLQIDGPGDVDVFSFQLSGDGQSDESVQIDYDHLLGSLSLELLDSSGVVIDRADDASDTEAINLNGLPAGTYYVRISGQANVYALSLSAPPVADPNGDWAEPNNSQGAAHDLGTLDGASTVTGLAITTANDVDWFQFKTDAGPVRGSGGSVTLNSDPSFGDLDFTIYDSKLTKIAASSGISSAKTLDLGNRGAAAYYLEVSGYEGSTNPLYSLQFQMPEKTIPPDSLEPNDSQADATELDGYNGTANLPGLSIQPGDQDYFQFDISATMTQDDVIAVSDPTDLRLEVLDKNGNRVLPRSGQAVGGSVDPTGLPAGHYYILVFGATPQTDTRYDLQFHTPTPSAGPGDWTIMVYMTASDLEDAAFQDINEMEDAATRLPGTVHIAVFLDQSAAGSTFATGGGNQPAWGTAGEALIQPDTDNGTIATSFQVFGEKDSGDPAVLGSFIAWAKQAAPANHYALILWDHGDGVSGVNFDNSDNTKSDYLTIPGVAQALASSNTHFDIVAFDACKMAMVEVAYALRSYATTIVASEEIEGSSGYDYNTAFTVLQTNPARVDAKSLAAGFVESYENQGAATAGDTESAVSGSALESLAGAIKSFTTAALSDTSSVDWAGIEQARYAATSFSNAPDDRDLGQFFQAIVDDTHLPSVIQRRCGHRPQSACFRPGRS